MDVCLFCDSPLTEENSSSSNVTDDEEIVVLSPSDQLCERCLLHFSILEDMEDELQHVKSMFLSNLKARYGILPGHQGFEGAEGPSGLAVGGSAASAAAVGTPFRAPLIRLTPEQCISNNKTFECTFCNFQSKDIKHIRLHMQIHTNKEEPETPILSQAVSQTLTPEKETEGSEEEKDEEDATLSELEDADKKTPENEVDEDNANVENKTGD